MFSIFRKSRRSKKAVSKKVVPPAISGDSDISGEKPGYDPYDTVPGRPRSEFGMRRQEDGKWSF